MSYLQRSPNPFQTLLFGVITLSLWGSIKDGSEPLIPHSGRNYGGKYRRSHGKCYGVGMNDPIIKEVGLNPSYFVRLVAGLSPLRHAEMIQRHAVTIKLLDLCMNRNPMTNQLWSISTFGVIPRLMTIIILLIVGHTWFKRTKKYLNFQLIL